MWTLRWCTYVMLVISAALHAGMAKDGQCGYFLFTSHLRILFYFYLPKRFVNLLLAEFQLTGFNNVLCLSEKAVCFVTSYQYRIKLSNVSKPFPRRMLIPLFVRFKHDSIVFLL